MYSSASSWCFPQNCWIHCSRAALVVALVAAGLTVVVGFDGAAVGPPPQAVTVSAASAATPICHEREKVGTRAMLRPSPGTGPGAAHHRSGGGGGQPEKRGLVRWASAVRRAASAASSLTPR